MAQQIRQTYRLPTIRIGFVPSGKGGLVLFDCFDGSEVVAQTECLASSIGIQPELNVRAYRDTSFQLPNDVCLFIKDQLKAVGAKGSPIWLQVESSSGHLAVVPWERLLHCATTAPLLRIPNFITDPVLPRGPLRLVLCLSSSQAKTPLEVIRYVHEFVAMTSQVLYAGSELHLFADSALYDAVEGLAQAGSFSVKVHNPHDAKEFGLDDSDYWLKNSATAIESPWLRWVAHSLAGKAVAAVHFVCPGYFSRDQGALVLSRSPKKSYDSDLSHLVGAEELIAFLNQVGAWYVGFSPPHDNVWAIGLRLLADRLVWQRPGALLLHDTESGSLVDLLEAFRLLFTKNEVRPSASPHLMLYCHPARLPKFRFQGQNFESVRAFGVPKPKAGLPEFEEPALKMSILTSATDEVAEQSGWQQSGMRLMDQILLESKGLDNSAQEGTLEALNKLSSLFKSGD